MSLEAWGDENPDDANYDSWSDHAVEAGWVDLEDHSPGAVAILRERERQETKEGWSPDHDDEHTDCSMAMVAALYAAPDPIYTAEVITGDNDRPYFFGFDDPWPSSWDDGWDKRQVHDRRRRLVIAGALIAAEIDRLDRLEKPQK